MELTLQDWIKVVGFVVLAANMALNVYLYRLARSSKVIDEVKTTLATYGAKIEGHEARTRQEIQILVQRDGDMDKRLSVLEERVSHMPTHGDLLSIKNELKDLNGAVAAVDERSENILGMVETIQKHLMEN